MRTFRNVAVALSLVSGLLTGCPGETVPQTVTASGLWCTVTGPSGTLDLVTLECVVKVGNTLVSKEGIETSVRSVLSANVLPDVCPSYTRAELTMNIAEFSDDLRDELAAAYVQANADWDIESVHCSITK